MKVCSLGWLMVLPVFLRAGPIDAAMEAAVKLGDAPNYSWTVAVDDDAGSYEAEGKLVRSSYTWLRMPMIDRVAERLGRSADIDLQVLFNGPSRYVILTDEGWKKFSELPRAPIKDEPPDAFQMMLASLNGVILPPANSSSFAPPEKRAPFRTLDLNYIAPHEELGVIVASGVNFKAEGDSVSGQLNDYGAQLLLLRDNNKEVSPLGAEGAFKLWAKNGAIVSYEVKLHAVLKVSGRTIEVHQHALTSLKDVNNTAFFVPDEAIEKLSH